MKIHLQFKKNPLLFESPRAIISCTRQSAVREAFDVMERALKEGAYLAGFLSYEAGASFEERLRDDRERDFPLVYMGVYDAPRVAPLPSKRTASAETAEDLRLNISRDRYFSHIAAIRDHIARGDVYQITYCLKLLFTYRGDPLSLYTTLLKEQPVPYPAYIETDRFHILSLSPEKFIRKTGTQVITKPMKGTWFRGRDLFSDLIERRLFSRDAKNRAENVMIADLLRNDLGRVGRKIAAPRLFEVTKYRTLFQMTSTVTGEVEKDIPLYNLFEALFPSGSVTGAPKIRAMEIIKGLEGEERKIYTGAIGYITPARDLFFNIPIRTILLEGGRGEMGIGGGIVWDSTPEGEWEEGLLKARFLTNLARPPGIAIDSR